MIAPIGFDVRGFVPQQGSPAIDMARAQMANSIAQQDALQQATNAYLQQKALREKLDFEREHLAEQGRQADMFEVGRLMRAQAELEAKAREEQMKREVAQRQLEGGLVGDATSAFELGDQAGLETVKAKAARLAPSLSMNLPGEVSYATGLGPNGVFDSEAAFETPAPSKSLNISQGGASLFSGDVATARRRQQEAARSALEPLVGSEGGAFDPFITSALNTAGLGGLGGVSAAQAAVKAGSEAAKRRQSGINAQNMAISRNEGASLRSGQAERDQLQDLHNMVEKIATGVESSVKLQETRKQMGDLAQIQAELASGDAWAQNQAGLQLMKSVIKGAASDYDARQMHQAAGFLNNLEKNLDYYLNGGELPANMREQMTRGLQLINSYNDAKVAASGLEAMQNVYRSPAIMAQLNSPQQAAYFALQAFRNVTGKDVTDDDVEKEAQLIAPQFAAMKRRFSGTPVIGSGGMSGHGGAGTSVRLGGALATPGALDGLGVAPLSPKPSGKDDAAALELLKGGGGGR